ncbi:magnesium transporter [Halobacteriovorax sp.]|uniref:magnesium transporter n=1 Tax=Halobacteriovorax sp. TaxID=2020862 RepID=UPI003564EAB2
MSSTITSLEKNLLDQYFESYPEKSISSLEELSTVDIVNIIKDFPVTTIVRILTQLKTDRGANVLVTLPDNIFNKVYSQLDPMRAAQLISKSDLDVREVKLSLLSDSEVKDIKEISSFPTGSAGSLMDQSIKTYRPSDTVKKVITDLQKSRIDHREVFILNLNGELVGYLPVRSLLYSNERESLERIMHKNPPSVNALSPREEITECFETFKTTVLPVTHIDGSLLGAIRYSSLVKEVQSQAIDSMATMGGASPSERALSPPIFSVGKRLPWLMINLLTAFIASAVVNFFEGTIAQVTALAILLPVVAGQSGNTGAQAMAVTMRGLALREVRVKQWAKLLFKELRVGFINGVFIAIVTGSAVYFWSNSFALGAVMTMAMILSMIIASISGAAIPIILTSLGKDPAQSSSVLLTTVTDVMGFISFLGLATLFISFLTKS